MKKIFFTFAICAILPFAAFSQKGKNAIQVSGQAAIATGDLSDVVKTGFGTAVKGMYGIGKNPQSLTVETGYNRFGVKNLPSGASGNYSAIPLYGGYRANLSGVIVESQAGVSFNHIAASGAGGSASANQTAFAWALSAGYQYKDIELSVRYQSSEGSDDTQPIRFVGIRLGYNFGL